MLIHKICIRNLLSLVICIRTNAIRISVLLPPKTFNDATINFCIMCGLYGVRRRFLSSEFNERISFIFEYSYVLDSTKGGKCFGYQVIRNTICKTSAIYCAISWTTLVIYLSTTIRRNYKNTICTCYFYR